MRGGWGRKAARCGMPRFLRPSGRSQRLRRAGGWGVGACRALQHAAFLAAFGPLATLAPCGGLGRGVHAAVCGLPRFLRPLGRSQRLRRAGWGAGGVGGMPRFAACRVSCGLWAARNACAVRGAGAWGHAAFCNLPRFLRPSGRSQRLRLLCCGTGIGGAAPNPGRGMIPLHPTLSPLLPYLTTRFLSLRKSSVTPSGGSPNVALSVLLPPSHVSCIAISRASIRQPSSTTVTTSPTS